MRCAVGKVDKERLVLVLFDILHRVVREIINHEALAFDNFNCVQNNSAPSVPNKNRNTRQFLEHLDGRHSVMPFSESSGLVASGFEVLKDSSFIQV